MTIIDDWRSFLAAENDLPEEKAASQEASLEERTLGEMSRDPEVRKEVVRAFRDQSNPALRQALGSLVLPPRANLVDNPIWWWDHPEVRLDAETMPTALALSLPVASVLLGDDDFAADPMSMCSSWFGGPAARLRSDTDTVVPQRSDGLPLTHVVHVDLADEAANQGPAVFARLGLPDDGAIQFFHDLTTEGWDEETDATAWRVRWLPADELEVPALNGASLTRRLRDRLRASSASSPAEDLLPLNPQIVPTIPSPLEPDLDDASFQRYQRAYDWLEELGTEMNTMARPDEFDLEDRPTPWDDGYEPLASLTRMGGYPSSERTDEITEILVAKLPLAGPDDHHVLLLDLNPDNYGRDEWFHGGHHLEVWTRHSDLESRRFDAVWCLIRTDT